MNRLRLTPLRTAVLTAGYVVGWRALVSADPGQEYLASGGWVGLYLIGFAWTVFLIERGARRVEARHAAPDAMLRPQIPVSGDIPGGRVGGWNPLDPAARVYSFWIGALALVVFAPLAVGAWLLVPRHGELMLRAAEGLTVVAVAALATCVAQSRRLRQTLAVVTAYSLFFGLLYVLTHLPPAPATDEVESDLPAGGGQASIKPQQQVKIKTEFRKKYVINPYSSIVFAAPPPIDKVELKLDVETAHQHKAGKGPGGLGQGEGKGGGFGSGTGGGKYEWVRFRHSDKAWNKNFGVGGDRNLLIELKVREPLVQIKEEDQSVDGPQLARYSPKKPLPLLYVGGAHTFAPSAADKKILREYLIDKHGMILGDNLGGGGFHNQFVAVMTEVTGVGPVVVPRDDRIHQVPYELPQLPIVVAHGGTNPLGWRVDGRWAVYYHPGALSDAWRDDHAGIKKVIWEQCYQLGINILYYAYAEQDKWRQSQKAGS